MKEEIHISVKWAKILPDYSMVLIHTITNRRELDEFEQLNIEGAIAWTMQKVFSKNEILSEKFVRDLHRKMFGDVWKWAGEFRTTEKTIGADSVQIGVLLKQLKDNCLYWIDNNLFSEEEIAIRYKYELVKIHCFANGNGRHSRIMADIIIRKIYDKPYFTWGSKNSINDGLERTTYLQAIRMADINNFVPLIEFARK